MLHSLGPILGAPGADSEEEEKVETGKKKFDEKKVGGKSMSSPSCVMANNFKSL